MKEHLLALVDRFAGTAVAVVADLVLDEFIYGEIARVSREAPVLIVDYRRLDAMPGGGANAAHNVRSLGGRPLPVGAVGDDEAGERLVSILREKGMETGGIVRLAGYPTPVKTRVLAGLPHSRPQQVVRLDRGTSARVPPESAGAAAETARGMLARGEAAGVLLSDYGYDLVTPESARPLIEEARRLDRPVTCDSRQRLKGFRSVTAATPNLEEAEAMAGARLDGGRVPLEEAARRMLGSLGCQAVLVTRGSRGMTLIEDGVRPFDIPVFGGDQVADVTGAGDTVIAAFTLALAAGATFRSAAILANCAAGLVVMKRGTATVTAGELKAAVERLPREAGS
ncbi:MAG TPA: PfkB family carbohydrate kinase [Candidatus Polarisedimenticolia bacterium]|nr:PfkB family carbohydrate kinase [Candidatus Polarisedimenticolia bacterium]